MHQIQEDKILWSDLEYPLFGMEIINREKRLARHALIQNMWRSLKVKPELPPQEPTIYFMIRFEPGLKTENWIILC